MSPTSSSVTHTTAIQPAPTRNPRGDVPSAIAREGASLESPVKASRGMPRGKNNYLSPHLDRKRAPGPKTLEKLRASLEKSSASSFIPDAKGTQGKQPSPDTLSDWAFNNPDDLMNPGKWSQAAARLPKKPAVRKNVSGPPHMERPKQSLFSSVHPPATLGYVRDMAKYLGANVELSPQMQARDPNSSLEGAIVLIGDNDHRDGQLHDMNTYTAFANFQQAGNAVQDDVLMSESGKTCAKFDAYVEKFGAQGATKLDEKCLRLDDPQAHREVQEAFTKASEKGNQFLAPLSKQALYPEDQAKLMEQNARQLEAKWGDRGRPLFAEFNALYGKYSEALHRAAPLREKAQLALIESHVSPERAVFAEAGSWHTENLKQVLFDRYPVIYITRK